MGARLRDRCREQRFEGLFRVVLGSPLTRVRAHEQIISSRGREVSTGAGFASGHLWLLYCANARRRTS